MIRPLSPIDLLRFPFLNHPPGLGGVETLDRLGRGQQEGVSPAVLLRESMRGGVGQCIWVRQEGESLQGFVSSRRRSGPRVWEVDHLYLASGDCEGCSELFEGLSLSIAQRGGQRLFLRTPSDSPLVELLCRLGFTPLYHEVLLQRQAAPKAFPHTPQGLRRRQRRDDWGLYHLYLASTPPKVRYAYATDLEEWQDAQERGGPAAREQVYERAGEVRAWCRSWGHSDGTTFQLLLHPSEPLEFLLATASGTGNVLALIPDHQSHTIQGLLQGGFTPVREYAVLMRPLTAKVSEVTFAPARV